MPIASPIRAARERTNVYAYVLVPGPICDDDTGIITA
jgi:hypothetical protein